MSSTDTTTTAAAPAAAAPSAAAPATSSVLGNIEAALSADAKKVVAFFQELETNGAAILAKIAAGAEVIVADIEALCQTINSKLGVINAGISATSTLAASVAPNNATLQKLISDVQTGVNDAASVSTALSSGSTSGDNTVVTTAVTTLNSVNTLAQLAAQAATMAGQTAAASPAATQAVSAPTPNEG